ncbi:MAG: endolytic transglycosylase MltG [Deltaproteobacteria bacterium]|nr:endolytic transglycosylase MltG [Deltaproteobacteria bacterium]
MSRGTALVVVGGTAALLVAAAVAALAILAAPRPVRLEATVVVREGWTIFDIARELERRNVCPASDFVAAATDSTLVRGLGVPADDAEGFLFPATYRLAVPTPAPRVVTRLVGTWKERAGRLLEARAARVEAAGRKLGGDGRLALVTIASMVEAEAAVAAERPRIASVIWNRLDGLDPELTRLQLDPTASYGCRRFPRLVSCARYAGRGPPSRAMLADATNPYNTYRRTGLPPGPIGNPGLDSLRAALDPERTTYLFYVAKADGSGTHAFSRTYEEHRRAVASR